MRAASRLFVFDYAARPRPHRAGHAGPHDRACASRQTHALAGYDKGAEFQRCKEFRIIHTALH